LSVALSLIFFVSGASALLFETLWFRLAGLAFGNSLWASSLVLAAFMAGLGLGNWLAGRYGPGIRRPLAAYAGIEVAIGVVGFGLVLGFPALTRLLAPLLSATLETPWLLQLLRLALAFVLLLVPSTAMGMTLPLLVKTLVARDGNFGRVLGLLYGCNTLGAFAGALSGELVLIGPLGLRGTGLVALALNLVAAGASFALSKAFSERTAAEAPPPAALAPRDTRRLRILAAAFLSGALLLGLEVVWFRFLQLFLLGSSLIFAVMLAVVLLGIAGGGLLASLWLSVRERHYRYAPAVALAAAALTAFTYLSFDDGFGIYGAYPVKPVPDPGPAFAIVAGLCLPVCILSGVLFTFLGRALSRETGDETRATAAVTLANTMGAMAGSLLAAFGLIPLAGVEGSFFLLGAGYGAVFLSSLGAGEELEASAHRSERLVLGLAAAGVALLFAFFPFGLMQNHFLPLTTRPHASDGATLAAMREGRTETALYLRTDLWEQPRYYRLVTNGFSMSSSTVRSQRYMRLYAYWPAALHPGPKTALLISYGLGVTAQALTEIGALESIDVVDISRDVLELSREVGLFEERHPLDDPRVAVHVEDGRFFLQTSKEEFDIITAEPPPPKNAAVGTLYSAEYFELLRDRLAPGGVATYWLPVYQLTVRESKAITRAFCDAFPDCTLWSGAGLEWMLAGARGEIPPSRAEPFGRPWAIEPMRARLAEIGLERPGQLGASFLGDAPFLADWVDGVPPLDDDHPHRVSSRLVLDLADATEAKEEYARILDAEGARARFLESGWVRRHWPAELREAALWDFQFQDAANRYFEEEGTTVGDLYHALTETELVTLPLFLMNATYQETNAIDDAVRKGLQDPVLEYFQAARSVSRREYGAALSHLESALRLDPASVHLEQYRILVLELSGERDAARNAARSLRMRTSGEGGLQGFWDWYDALAPSTSD
jgi:predicted membrane-bound spermidine synthase